MSTSDPLSSISSAHDPNYGRDAHHDRATQQHHAGQNGHTAPKDPKLKRKHKFSIGLILFTLATILGIAYLHQIGQLLGASIPDGAPSDSEMKALAASHNAARFHVESIACHEETARKTDWCQVTDKQGTVLFKGDFLPVGSVHRAPQSQLQIGPFDTLHGWVHGPSELVQVPVIPLTNGTLLVPADDTYQLKKRWASHPEELAEVTPVSVPPAPKR